MLSSNKIWLDHDFSNTPNPFSVLPYWYYRWIFSTNHKDIGTLYFIFGVFSGIIASTLIMLIHIELVFPWWGVLPIFLLLNFYKLFCNVKKFIDLLRNNTFIFNLLFLKMPSEVTISLNYDGIHDQSIEMLINSINYFNFKVLIFWSLALSAILMGLILKGIYWFLFHVCGLIILATIRGEQYNAFIFHRQRYLSIRRYRRLLYYKVMLLTVISKGIFNISVVINSKFISYDSIYNTDILADIYGACHRLGHALDLIIRYKLNLMGFVGDKLYWKLQLLEIKMALNNILVALEPMIIVVS